MFEEGVVSMVIENGLSMSVTCSRSFQSLIHLLNKKVTVFGRYKTTNLIDERFFHAEQQVRRCYVSLLYEYMIVIQLCRNVFAVEESSGKC